MSPTIATPLRRRTPSHGAEASMMDDFDSIKREATKLERQLEDKVARYQQVRNRCVHSVRNFTWFFARIKSPEAHGEMSILQSKGRHSF